MVIYYRFGINFLKPMNRHDWKRIRLRRKGIIQQKPTTNQKRQKHNNQSNSGCTPYDPKSDPGYMDEIDMPHTTVHCEPFHKPMNAYHGVTVMAYRSAR